MRKSFIALMALFTMFGTTNANAGSAGQAYGGVQYGMVTYSEPGFPDFEPSMLVMRAGQYLSDSLAIEGRFGFGLSDDSQSFFVSGFGTLDLELEVDNLFGIYAIGHMNMSPSSSLYGLIGFTSAELTASANGFSVSGDDSGLSYGIGFEHSLGGSNSFNIEYTSYLDEDAFDASALSIGMNFSF